jgi:hypothetical protein
MVYKVRPKPWGLSGSLAIVIDPRLGVERQGHFVRGTWRPPSLVEKLLSGGGINVASA